MIGVIASSRVNIPRTGLVGEWLFKGNANDSSGNGNHGTVSGATLVTGRKGIANTAYKFTNSADIINCGTGSSLRLTTYVSMSYWINCTSTSFYGRHINKEGLYGSMDGSGVNNKIHWYGSGIDADINTSNPFNYMDGNWHHIVVLYDGSNIKLYIDSNFISQTAKTGALSDIQSSPLTIGNRITDLGRPTKATLQDIRLYNVVLSQSDITKLYNE